MLQVNADLDMELNPQAQPWPYQAKSLNRMFGNGNPHNICKLQGQISLAVPSSHAKFN